MEIWSSVVVKMPDSPSNVMTVRMGSSQVCVELLYWMGKKCRISESSILHYMKVGIVKWTFTLTASDQRNQMEGDFKRTQSIGQEECSSSPGCGGQSAATSYSCLHYLANMLFFSKEPGVFFISFRKPSLRITRSIKVIGLLMPSGTLSWSVCLCTSVLTSRCNFLTISISTFLPVYPKNRKLLWITFSKDSCISFEAAWTCEEGTKTYNIQWVIQWQ